MTVITEEQFTQAMRDAVAERGEGYEYNGDPAILSGPRCSYRHADGQPGCLIGLALDKLGITDPEETEAPEALKPYGLSKTVRAAAVEAQVEQDLGTSWGQALAIYLEKLADPDLDEVCNLD